MKIFFDTNVYVAEAIFGAGAERMLEATRRASWRTYCCQTVVEEIDRVLVEQLGFSRRLSILTRARVLRHSVMIEPGALRHYVPQDPNDSPILIAALRAVQTTSLRTTRIYWP